MKTSRTVWDWRTHILNDGPDSAPYKHLLLTLSCYMDSAGGSCFPSLRTLEKATSLSRPTIIKYLKKAGEDGWLKIKKGRSDNNVWERNNYTASLPEEVVKELNHPAGKVVKEVNQGGKADSEGVVKEVNSNSPYNTSSINSPKEKSESIVDRVNRCENIEDLYEIYAEYRRQKNRSPTTYEQDASKYKMNEWGIEKSKKIMIEAIRNGWISLKKTYLDGSKNQGKFETEGRPNAGAYNFD